MSRMAKVSRAMGLGASMPFAAAQSALKPTDELKAGIEYVRALVDDIASSLTV